MIKVVEHEYPPIAKANKLVELFNGQISNHQVMLVRNDATSIQQLNDAVGNTMQVISDEIGALDHLLSDSTSRRSLGSAVAIRKDFLASGQRVRELVDAGERKKAIREYLDVMNPLQQRLKGALLEVVNREDDLMAEAGVAAHQTYQSTRLFMLLLVAVRHLPRRSRL
ncbi:TPA: hypothetical protein ACPWM7_005123 [Pseudomonas aeruginosa]